MNFAPIRTSILPFAFLIMTVAGYYPAIAATDDPAINPSEKIYIIADTVYLEMTFYNDDFPCIALGMADPVCGINAGTYVEVKRDGGDYLVEIRYKIERFPSIDKGLRVYLQERFERFYNGRDEERGKRVWKIFVKEGGLKRFLDIAKGWMDDHFLDTPFNTIYG